MPYTKSPRPYKKEYKKQKERGEHPARMERQRARRKYDEKGINRKGKQVVTPCTIHDRERTYNKYAINLFLVK